MTDFHELYPKGGQGKTHPYLEREFERLYSNNLSTKSILEYGCGKGHALTHYNEIYNTDIQGYDPGIEQYSSQDWRGRFWDVIYSVDVLEHIPLKDLTGKTGELEWISVGFRDYAILIIDQTLAKKTKPNGDNEHCTLLSNSEWLTLISKHMNIAHWENDVQPDKTFGNRQRICLTCTRKVKM